MLSPVVVLGSMALFGTITVDTFDDELNKDDDCSLREAIQSVNMKRPLMTAPPAAQSLI